MSSQPILRRTALALALALPAHAQDPDPRGQDPVPQSPRASDPQPRDPQPRDPQPRDPGPRDPGSQDPKPQDPGDGPTLAERLDAIEKAFAEHQREAAEINDVVIRTLDGTTTRLDLLLDRLEAMDAEAAARAADPAQNVPGDPARAPTDPAGRDPEARDPDATDPSAGRDPEAVTPGPTPPTSSSDASSPAGASGAAAQSAFAPGEVGLLGRTLERLRSDAQLQWMVLGGIVLLAWAIGRLFSGRAPVPRVGGRTPRALDAAMSQEEALGVAAGADLVGAKAPVTLGDAFVLDLGEAPRATTPAPRPQGAPPGTPEARRGTLHTPLGAGIERLGDRKDVVILGPAPRMAGVESASSAIDATPTESAASRSSLAKPEAAEARGAEVAAEPPRAEPGDAAPHAERHAAGPARDLDAPQRPTQPQTRPASESKARDPETASPPSASDEPRSITDRAAPADPFAARTPATQTPATQAPDIWPSHIETSEAETRVHDLETSRTWFGSAPTDASSRSASEPPIDEGYPDEQAEPDEAYDPERLDEDLADPLAGAGAVEFDESDDDFLLLWDDPSDADSDQGPVIRPLGPEAPRSATTVDQDGGLARLSVPGVDHERAAHSVREAVAGESWVVQSPPPEVVCRNGVLEVSLRFLPNTPAGERSRILARARRAIL